MCFVFDDQRRRQRDGVARGADQQPPLEALQVHDRRRAPGEPAIGFQLDARDQPVVADVDDVRQPAQGVHRLLEDRRHLLRARQQLLVLRRCPASRVPRRRRWDAPEYV